jgi:hypothetical protein
MPRRREPGNVTQPLPEVRRVTLPVHITGNVTQPHCARGGVTLPGLRARAESRRPLRHPVRVDAAAPPRHASRSRTALPVRSTPPS